jgi:hypothetical protein
MLARVFIPHFLHPFLIGGVASQWPHGHPWDNYCSYLSYCSTSISHHQHHAVQLMFIFGLPANLHGYTYINMAIMEVISKFASALHSVFLFNRFWVPAPAGFLNPRVFTHQLTNPYGSTIVACRTDTKLTSCTVIILNERILVIMTHAPLTRWIYKEVILIFVKNPQLPSFPELHSISISPNFAKW